MDTSVCIAIIRGNRHVQTKVLEIGRENCYVSEMSIAELYYGASKSGKESHFRDVRKILYHFQVMPVFDSLETYGTVKASLESKGRRIDEMDLLIGSTALHNHMILVTHNVKHLNRIPNLKIEDWEAPSASSQSAKDNI